MPNPDLDPSLSRHLLLRRPCSQMDSPHSICDICFFGGRAHEQMAEPSHQWQWLLWQPCSQTAEPLQILQLLLRRSCSQMLSPATPDDSHSRSSRRGFGEEARSERERRGLRGCLLGADVPNTLSACRSMIHSETRYHGTVGTALRPRRREEAAGSRPM